MQCLPNVRIHLVLSLQHIEMVVALEFHPKVLATEAVPGFVADVVADAIADSLVREETVVFGEHAK